MPWPTSSSTTDPALSPRWVAGELSGAVAPSVPVPDAAARQAAAAKLAAARTRLILDQPFLGAMVLRLPLVEAGAWCRSTATDARKLYYNPQWIRGLALRVGPLCPARSSGAAHVGLGL